MKQRALAISQPTANSRYSQEQSDANPIIYHHTYSQNYPQQAMQGTLINENFMPRSHTQQPQQQYVPEQEMSENIQYPDIPMGRPLQQPYQRQPYNMRE
jgi:hypothetical protein